MNKKISQLSLLSSLTGEEEFPLALDGNNAKIKAKDLVKLANAGNLDLGNVDNTSDQMKVTIPTNPVKIALDAKSNTGHHHSLAEIDGLTTALSGKAPLVHQHDMIDIAGLAAEFNRYSLVGHGHLSAEIADFGSAIEQKLQQLKVTVTMQASEW